MNSATLPSASATLSGRELALKRRKAMALNGKAALTRSQPSVAMPLAAAANSRASADAKPAPQALLTTPLINRHPGRLRREALSQHGKAAPDAVRLEQSSGREFARARRSALAQEGKGGLKRIAQATHFAAQLPVGDGQAALDKGASGRQVAMHRRMVLAQTGRPATSSTDSSGAGRRTVGRVRPKVSPPSTAPEKVEEGHTLRDQPVTGTQVERSMMVTGNESGSCRAVTGTEYIGAEQFDNLCERRSSSAPTKVAVSTTLGEQKVTGIEVGRSANVTGDELGACRGITGTEYLSAERYDEFCASRPEPAPKKVYLTEMANGKKVSGLVIDRPTKVTGDEAGAARSISGTTYMKSSDSASAPQKVGQTHTAAGKAVTGTRFGQSENVSGGEAGACRGITGTEYLSQEQFVTTCGTQAPVRPLKVSVMSSRGQQAVSGTEVGRSSNVTGDEPGSCQHITGSQYFTPESFGMQRAARTPAKAPPMNACAGRGPSGIGEPARPKPFGDDNGRCLPVTGIKDVGSSSRVAYAHSTPVAPASKVRVDQARGGQPLTGSYFGPASKMTGNEFDGSARVSGSQYAGPRSLDDFCQPSTVMAGPEPVRPTAVISAAAVTGDRPGAGGSAMTGDTRGACKPVSGTPYIGADNSPPSCAVSGRFLSRQSSVEATEPSPAPLGFSIQTPARVAHDQTLSQVTGNSFGIERITGAANKAGGLITGTPEFRHQVVPRPVAAEAQLASPAGKVTGEGSQAGREVTGDAWHAARRVSGTEGASSLMRNPSAKGTPRGMGVNAQVFRTIEKPVVPVQPENRITGSSGSSGKGASVTLSGGARG